MATQHFSNHLKECNKLTCCPYQEKFGCKGVFNESLKDHLSNKHNYDGEVASYLHNISKENEELREALAKAKYLSEKNKNEVDKALQKVEEAQIQVEGMANVIVEKNNLISKLRQEMQHFSKVFQDIKNPEFYTNKLKEIQTIQEQLGGGSTLLKSTNELQSLQTLSENETLIKRLENEQALLNASLADTELKIQLLENLSTDGHQIWRIDNFRHRLDQAKKGKILALHSAPCYTSLNGYKFCIRVYPNGDGMGKGTHLSIYFVLMKNHYDSLLQWPFHRKITFRVINLRDKTKSKKETFITDKTSTSFKKPEKEMNIAAGCPKFLGTDNILGDGFLMDDCIFIETLVEKADSSAKSSIVTKP